MDIVERLRQGVGHLPEDCMDAERWMDRAADEIERLRAERLAFATESEERRAEIERLRTLVGLADDLRRAQQAYMADRGNNEKGRLVGVAADLYDRVRALKDTIT